MTTEKPENIDHVEQAWSQGENSDGVVGYEANLDELPKGYYRSRFFLGSMLATGLGLWAGVCAFVGLIQQSCPRRTQH